MDLRIERTRRSIINAFIELRAQKPIEKITIKELSELACINKATFYSHYHDIYDLSEQLEKETISTIIKSIPHPESFIINPKQAVQELCFALYSQNELFHTLFSGTRASLMAGNLEAVLKEEIYTLYPKHKDDLKLDIILSVLIQGCFQAFLSHSDYNVEEVIQILGEIDECIIKDYLTEISQ